MPYIRHTATDLTGKAGIESLPPEEINNRSFSSFCYVFHDYCDKHNIIIRFLHHETELFLRKDEKNDPSYKREATSGSEFSRVASGNSIIGSCGKRSFK